MPHAAPGFTLLELVVALAIAGALLFLGAPGLGSVIAERELDDRADALIHALDRARSEAIKRGARVHVCPVASGGCPGAAAPWEGGWTIAMDGATPAIAPERPAPEGVTIRGNRPVADYVSYTSMGLARRVDGALQMGTFTLCRRGQKARRIVLAQSGRARLERATEACP